MRRITPDIGLAFVGIALVGIIGASDTPPGAILRMTLACPLMWSHVITGPQAESFALIAHIIERDSEPMR